MTDMALLRRLILLFGWACGAEASVVAGCGLGAIMPRTRKARPMAATAATTRMTMRTGRMHGL